MDPRRVTLVPQSNVVHRVTGCLGLAAITATPTLTPGGASHASLLPHAGGEGSPKPRTF